MSKTVPKTDYITMGQVLAMMPFAASYYWLAQQAHDPDFPIGRRVSPKKVLFQRAAIEAWIKERFAKTNEKPTPRPAAAPRNRAKA